MLAWVKKRRRTIRREDLISFLCGKAPPHRSSRANPRLTMVAPSRANSPAETGSSVEADLQPFREAIALHGENLQNKSKPARPKRVFQPDTNILMGTVLEYNPFYCPCASVNNERQCHIGNICHSKNKKAHTKSSSREMLSNLYPECCTKHGSTLMLSL